LNRRILVPIMHISLNESIATRCKLYWMPWKLLMAALYIYIYQSQLVKIYLFFCTIRRCLKIHIIEHFSDVNSVDKHSIF